MSSSKIIKGRIKSAKNIAQITKAMEMVAASKMRKSQNLALSGKPYAEKIYQAVYELAERSDPILHPLLKRHSLSHRKLVIMISSNKGVCGSLNTNLFRVSSHWFKDEGLYEYIAIGKKSEIFIVRTGRKLIATFSQTTSFTECV